MRTAIKCLHPLFLADIGLLLPFLALLVQITDIIPASKTGPCSIPVFLLFVPGEFMVVLGVGFSAIRIFELRAGRRRARGDSALLAEKNVNPQELLSEVRRQM